MKPLACMQRCTTSWKAAPISASTRGRSPESVSTLVSAGVSRTVASAVGGAGPEAIGTTPPATRPATVAIAPSEAVGAPIRRSLRRRKPDLVLQFCKEGLPLSTCALRDGEPWCFASAYALCLTEMDLHDAIFFSCTALLRTASASLRHRVIQVRSVVLVDANILQLLAFRTDVTVLLRHIFLHSLRSTNFRLLEVPKMEPPKKVFLCGSQPKNPDLNSWCQTGGPGICRSN